MLPRLARLAATNTLLLLRLLSAGYHGKDTGILALRRNCSSCSAELASTALAEHLIRAGQPL